MYYAIVGGENEQTARIDARNCGRLARPNSLAVAVLTSLARTLQRSIVGRQRCTRDRRASRHPHSRIQCPSKSLWTRTWSDRELRGQSRRGSSRPADATMASREIWWRRHRAMRAQDWL